MRISLADRKEVGNGAQGRNRTTDTAIFSRVLYQLSYLGISTIAIQRRFVPRGGRSRQYS